MKFTKRAAYRSVFVVAIFASFFLLPIAVTHAAFGISPPFLNADHLVPGAKYTQTIYLVQDQPDSNLNIVANLQIDQPASSWISLDQGTNFVIPQGVRQFPVQITIAVPSNAGLGVYRGNLTFTTMPESQGQVTIALGAQVAINMTVGTGTFEKYSVPLITLPDIQEGQDPVVDVKFENDGNVPESFDGATYELFDQYDNVRLAYIQKSNDFPVTPPFTISDYRISFPAGFYLGVGEYWGVVTFYKNGQVVASQKGVFNVLKATFFNKMVRLAESNWISLLIALIFVVAVVVYVIRTRKNRSAV
jgi:hypothetical protein